MKSFTTFPCISLSLSHSPVSHGIENMSPQLPCHVIACRDDLVAFSQNRIYSVAIKKITGDL